jgi:hypothetical protein
MGGYGMARRCVTLLCGVGALVLTIQPARAQSAAERPVKRTTVLFICPHGAAKSVLASAYFPGNHPQAECQGDRQRRSPAVTVHVPPCHRLPPHFCRETGVGAESLTSGFFSSFQRAETGDSITDRLARPGFVTELFSKPIPVARALGRGENPPRHRRSRSRQPPPSRAPWPAR